MGGGSQVPVSDPVGGPGLRFSGAESWSQIFRGGPSLRFSGGVPVSDFLGGSQSQIFGGGPGLRFSGGVPVSDFGGGRRYPVSVKGKIFDTRFGLIHVQAGKKNFCRGTPPQ